MTRNIKTARFLKAKSGHLAGVNSACGFDLSDPLFHNNRNYAAWMAMT